MAFKVSEAAAENLLSLLSLVEDSDHCCFRLDTVLEDGSNGFCFYDILFEDLENDDILFTEQGIRFVVKNSIKDSFTNLLLDYQERTGSSNNIEMVYCFTEQKICSKRKK